MGGADGSDGRFRNAMDKLLQLEALTTQAASSSIAPRDGPAKPGNARSPTPEKSVSKGAFVPVCRPWERADLLRRLATFKSSTWFGKPTVAGPVSCARRGWVNIESDLIACEGCGAQLSFVVPPTWSRQQASKAADDFAKKLEVGHRELCAWQGNACPEALVQFPPTTSATLQAAFTERCERLMELSGLPVVAKEALDTMRISRGPQVTRLLEQDPPSPLKKPSAGRPPGEDSVATSQYLESLRLIAVCGWEPRLLPASITPALPLPIGSPSQRLPITNPNPNPNPTPSLASTVLDCGLCGASVGLWSFSAVARPQTGVTYSPGPAVAEIDEEGLALQVDEQVEEQPTRSTAHRPSKEEKEQPTQSTGHNGAADRPESTPPRNSPPAVRSEKRTQDEADSGQVGSMRAPASGRKSKGLPPVARQLAKNEEGEKRGPSESKKRKKPERGEASPGQPLPGGKLKAEPLPGGDQTGVKEPGESVPRPGSKAPEGDFTPEKGAQKAEGSGDVRRLQLGENEPRIPAPGPIDTVDLSPTRLLPLGSPTLADLAWSTIAGGTTAAAIGEQVPANSGPFGKPRSDPPSSKESPAKPDSSGQRTPDFPLKPESSNQRTASKDQRSGKVKSGDSESDGNDRGGGALRTVVGSNSRPPRSPIVDLNLTIAGGPPPSPNGETARPVFGPGAILHAPIFGLQQTPSPESGTQAPVPEAETPVRNAIPVQAASFESRGAPAAPPVHTPESRQGFSQGLSHDGKLSHFSPQLAGGSTVTTPHSRVLKRKPADSAEAMVLEHDGGDDEMEVEGGGRPSIPAHLTVLGSSRFSRPANRQARPQETGGVESVNVDIGGSVEARGAPDVRGGREASVSGMPRDRAGSVDNRYRRPASREIEGEPSVDVMDSAGGTSAAVIEEVEEVMGAPRTAKRRRIQEAPWRGGQVSRLAAAGSPGDADFPRTSSVNATATNHSYEQPETSTESVRNMPRADSRSADDERAPNDDEATTQPPLTQGLEVSPEAVVRSAADRFEGLPPGFGPPGFGFQGFGALPEEAVVSTGLAPVSAGMGGGGSEERGAMGSEGLGAGGSTGKGIEPSLSLEPSLGGSTRAGGNGRVDSIGFGGGYSFAGEAGYDTEEAMPNGVARPWDGEGSPRQGRGSPREPPQLEQSIIHTPVRGLIVGGATSSGSEGAQTESQSFALNGDETTHGGRTFTNGTAEAEVRGGDEEELADAEGGGAPPPEMHPPVFAMPRTPVPQAVLRLPPPFGSTPGGVAPSAEFDPLRQHRHFCPWVNGHPAGRGREAVLSGWQRCVDALATERGEARPALSSRLDNESSGSFARIEYGASAASLLRAALTRRSSLDESRM